MTTEELVAQYAPRGPQEVVRALAEEQAQRADSKALVTPIVTLMLCDGCAISGHVIGLAKEHDEVPAALWKSAAVKGPANCAACHTRAEDGDYAERSLRLPK